MSNRRQKADRSSAVGAALGFSFPVYVSCLVFLVLVLVVLGLSLTPLIPELLVLLVLVASVTVLKPTLLTAICFCYYYYHYHHYLPPHPSPKLLGHSDNDTARIARQKKNKEKKLLLLYHINV